MTVEAHFTERNSPIFQKDSDFEVFVDPLGSCHGYKEYEVNALNTVWNLMLDRPYGDGGVEHSGRIAKPGDALYYDVKHQKICYSSDSRPCQQSRRGSYNMVGRDCNGSQRLVCLY